MTGTQSPLPRILVIDDILGRRVDAGPNEERADICSRLLLRDVTGDQEANAEAPVVHAPSAEAVFFRGQRPAMARVGDRVENDLDACLEKIRSGWSARPAGSVPWAMVLLDLSFYTGEVTGDSDRRMRGMPEGHENDRQPDGFFGLTILKRMREQFPGLPVVILSGQPRQAVSREIDAHGALAFIGSAMPGALDRFRDYLVKHALLPDLPALAAPSAFSRRPVIGCSIELLHVLRAARRAARAGSRSNNIMIFGESGTGKELLAAYVHQWGREQRPFVPVNSGSLSPELYGSELFGHQRGSFTGSVANRVGRIREADTGDLFLDEIGNMPADVQAGLLRVIAERVVSPLGSDGAGEAVDVRFISATNEDLEGMVVAGTFRDDLFQRLSFGGGVLRLPALRDRRDDLPLLAESFFQKAVAATPGASVRVLSAEALDALQEYDWPGNIRELEGRLNRAVADHADVETLFPLHFGLPRPSSWTKVAARAGAEKASGGLRLEDVIEALEDKDADAMGAAELAGALPRLQGAYARTVALMLLAAIKETKRPVADDPEGRVLIHPAVKLLMGTREISASAAADVIKRLLKIAPASIADLMERPELRDAATSAERQRPKDKGKGKGTGKGAGNASELALESDGYESDT